MTLSIMPIPKVQLFDANGDPLAGGKVYFYDAGTSNPKATYTDYTGQTPNSNPVVLDSRGEASIWLSGYYKIVVKDSAGNLVYEIDYVSSMPSAALVASEWLSPDHTVTYVGATQFSVPGDETATYQVGRRVKCVVSAGTVYGTISVSTYSGGATTVTVVFDSGSFDSGLSDVDVGILSATNPAIPMAYIKGKDPIFRALDSAHTQVIELKYDETNDKLVLNAPETGATMELQLQGGAKLILGATGLQSPILITPKIPTGGYIQESGGTKLIEFGKSATPVNWMKLESSDTGAGPKFSAQGADAHVDLVLEPKGSGLIKGPRLGAWDATKVKDTVYQAATDLHVHVSWNPPGTGLHNMQGLTDGSNPPTTIVARDSRDGLTGAWCTFAFSVKKGDYWKVSDVTTGATVEIDIIPEG